MHFVLSVRTCTACMPRRVRQLRRHTDGRRARAFVVSSQRGHITCHAVLEGRRPQSWCGGAVGMGRMRMPNCVCGRGRYARECLAHWSCWHWHRQRDSLGRRADDAGRVGHAAGPWRAGDRAYLSCIGAGGGRRIEERGMSLDDPITMMAVLYLPVMAAITIFVRLRARAMDREEVRLHRK